MVLGAVLKGVALAGVLSVAIPACTGEEPGGPSTPFAPSAPSPSPSVRSSPSPARKNLVSPSSPLAVVGERYPVRLFTHCGIDQAAVDFDGSWWNLVPGSDEGRFGFTFTRGTMTLMPDGTAFFRARSEAIARFVRHSGPIRQPGCY